MIYTYINRLAQACALWCLLGQVVFFDKLKNALNRYIVVCFLLYFFFLCENYVIIMRTFPNKK